MPAIPPPSIPARTLAPPTSKIRLRVAEAIVESPRKAGLSWADDSADDLAAYLTTTNYLSTTNTVKLPIRFLSINAEALFCGFTNGWLGYLPTAKAFEQGGYEPNTSPFTDKAEQHLTEAVLKVLHGWPQEL